MLHRIINCRLTACLTFFTAITLLWPLQAHTQIINTIAGNGIRGYAGDGGPATAAASDNPTSVVVDASGEVYFFDANNRIRKIDNRDTLRPFAGSGCGSPCVGFSGDGGPATSAQLTVNGLFRDGAGNMYFSDASHHIRKITGGIISTIAGTGTGGYNGDHIAATSAEIYYATQVVVDVAGNIFFVDSWNHRIRKIDAAGVITTIAGTGVKGYGGDGGSATAALLCYPGGLALDNSGNIFISDSQRVRKINTAGIITQLPAMGHLDFWVTEARQRHHCYMIQENYR